MFQFQFQNAPLDKKQIEPLIMKSGFCFFWRPPAGLRHQKHLRLFYVLFLMNGIFGWISSKTASYEIFSQTVRNPRKIEACSRDVFPH